MSLEDGRATLTCDVRSSQGASGRRLGIWRLGVTSERVGNQFSRFASTRNDLAGQPKFDLVGLVSYWNLRLSFSRMSPRKISL